MDWHKQRDTAMVLTLAYNGMRRSELLNLSVGDVDFNRQMITIVKGKGNKDQAIPMASRIIVPLRSQCNGKGAQQKMFENVNTRSVYRVITGLAKAYGLSGFQPYSFRHYFATQLIELTAIDKGLRITRIIGHI